MENPNEKIDDLGKHPNGTHLTHWDIPKPCSKCMVKLGDFGISSNNLVKRKGPGVIFHDACFLQVGCMGSDGVKSPEENIPLLGCQRLTFDRQEKVT